MPPSAFGDWLARRLTPPSRSGASDQWGGYDSRPLRQPWHPTYQKGIHHHPHRSTSTPTSTLDGLFSSSSVEQKANPLFSSNTRSAPPECTALDRRVRKLPLPLFKQYIAFPPQPCYFKPHNIAVTRRSIRLVHPLLMERDGGKGPAGRKKTTTKGSPAAHLTVYPLQ